MLSLVALTVYAPGMMRRLCVLSVALACACANQQGATNDDAGDFDEQPDRDPTERGESGRPENMPSVSFAGTADENWKLAEEAFADEDYLVAQRYYSYIRNKFPYSQFAAVSAVRIGDCQYARERYIEAIDSYQNFVRLYPTHEKAAFATLRIGLSYYEQIPTDWFLLPPAHEKEQTAARDAERALREYVERYPKDASIEEGKKALTDVRKKLADHERYVANFYRRLDKDRAVVGRLEVLRRDYGDVALDDELLFDIASLWAKIGEVDKAKSALAELEKKFPGSPRISEARQNVQNAKTVSNASSG